jgi:hypothetical protein
MAVELLGASNARLEWPSRYLPEASTFHTALTVALTIRTASSLAGVWLLGQWRASGGAQSFGLVRHGSNDIQLSVRGPEGIWSQGTTTGFLATDTEYRIVTTVTLNGSPTMNHYVNGVLQVDATLSGAAVTTMQQVDQPVAIGYNNATFEDGVDGAYSEVAIWDHVVPDWVIQGYTKGMSPAFYRHGGLFYAPCWNDTAVPELWSHWGSATNTAGTASAHPRVFYPATPFHTFGAGSADTSEEVEPEIGQSFGPLIWAEFAAPDGTTHVWAPVDLPDPDSYYHGYKSPKLITAGRVVRALSDEQGEYQGQTFEITISDIDKVIRSFLGRTDAQRHLINRLLVLRMISEEDWRAKRTPRTVAIGKVRRYTLS